MLRHSDDCPRRWNATRPCSCGWSQERKRRLRRSAERRRVVEAQLNLYDTEMFPELLTARGRKDLAAAEKNS